MERWIGDYARYFSKKHKQKIPNRVFEANFKSQKVNTWKSLKYCLFYVENNAIKHQIA